MISEPEMVGGSQAAPAPLPAPRTAEPAGPERDDDAASDLIEGASSTEPPTRRRLPRHWTWALTAAATTCALWAAGLTAWQHAQPDGPDLHGYQLTGSPCARGSLAPLVGTSPTHSYTNPALFSHGPALDRADCSAGTVEIHGSADQPLSSTVSVSVELHKKTDPRAEFADQRSLTFPALSSPSLVPADEVTPVPGLGDEAYLLAVDSGEIELKVLHGGLVLQLSYSIGGDDAGHATTLVAVSPADGSTTGTASTGAPPDVTAAFRKPLVAAARNILTNLRS